MFSNKTTLNKLFSALVIFILIVPAFNPTSVLAQDQDDGIRRQVNAESGKVNFIGPAKGSVLPAQKALQTTIRPKDPSMALAIQFAPEFGVNNPQRDLSEIKSITTEEGRITTRFQQEYSGIPVIAAELIVNTNQNGDLYSMNGEVSTNLSLPTKPTIDSAQAKTTALEATAKWYDLSPNDFIATEPELWIFDESLLQSSNRPAELVWRLEVTGVDSSIPVRELVLVNANNGRVSFHFNQIDNAWHAEQPTITEEPSPSIKPALAGLTWYVATIGDDTNDCLAPNTPCATIQAAVDKATADDIIWVAEGIYTSASDDVVFINKNLSLSGGWDSSFTTRVGHSTIDGGDARRGVYVFNGIVSLDYFIIQNGYESGGGVFNNSTLTINNSVITDNLSIYANGGGIWNFGTLTINNSTIKNNIAGSPGMSGGGGGGGIKSDYGTLILNNSLVYGNSLLGFFSGSGIHASGTASGVILNNTTISGNTGGYGEGIYLFIADLTSYNSTITDNESYGIRISLGDVTLQNTIIAKNGPSGDCFNTDSGTINSQGYNLIGNDLNCVTTPSTGDQIGNSINPINPQLFALQDNGGITLTHALLENSPALDAGNPAMPGSGGVACLSTDQRGVARPVGSTCDIGAFEGTFVWSPNPLVNTFTSNNSTNLPGTFLCNQLQTNCTNGSDPHADAAHKYAISTYNLFATQHERGSIDNYGMTIVSSVHYANGYDNAFWNGEQMVYGDAYGFPLADDLVAHELTHGVTQYESNLFYYYQSGAINESLSDIWGEFEDQTNGQGTDTAGVKWLLGEDVSGAGAARSMSNPPTYGHPDKMSSTLYYEGNADNGGVHSNSGVNNKAVYLMVDGGTFNTKTVTALGWEKTAKIYYEVQTNLLSSGSDYSDLYYALQQACANLVGQHGITAANCVEVKDALDAVEMNSQPATNFNPDAPLCTSPSLPYATDVYTEGFENGLGSWTINNGPTLRWQLDSPYGQFAHSGEHFLYGDDYPQNGTVTDARAQWSAKTIPAGAYLHFSHAYDFEYSSGNNWDGGVIEYSTNGGTTWTDAGSLIVNNGYTGVIYNGAGANNPLKGKNAFAKTSHGYISTRLNLASLTGQSVTFRWRMGLDDVVFSWGWWVDDVRIYTCSANPTISGNVGVPGVSVSYVDGTAKTVTSQQDGSYAIVVSNHWTGTVTPSHGCYTFDPVNRSYNNVSSNLVNQNFTATPNSSPGEFSVNCSSLNFGNQLFWTGSANQTVTVTNNSNISAQLGVLSTGSAAYRLVNDTCSNQSLAASTSCTVDVYFFPASYDGSTINATLTIPSNATNAPHSVALTGVGILGTQILQNPSFETDSNNDKVPDNWTGSSLNLSVDGRTSQFTKHLNYSFKLVGAPITTKTLRQTYMINLPAGTDVLVVTWGKADNVPATDGFFAAVMTFYNGNTQVAKRSGTFTIGTHDWEQKRNGFTLPGAITKVVVDMYYSKASGSVWFDLPRVYWAP